MYIEVTYPSSLSLNGLIYTRKHFIKQRLGGLSVSQMLLECDVCAGWLCTVRVFPRLPQLSRSMRQNPAFAKCPSPPMPLWPGSWGAGWDRVLVLLLVSPPCWCAPREGAGDCSSAGSLPPIWETWIPSVSLAAFQPLGTCGGSQH